MAELHAAGINLRYSHKFGDVGRLLGQVRLHQGALFDAAALAARSTEINRELIEHDPTNANWRRALYASLGFQGEVATAAGQHDQATIWLNEAITGLTQLSESEPRSLCGRSRPVCKAVCAVHISAASWPIATAMGRRIVENLSSRSRLFASIVSTAQAPSDTEYSTLLALAERAQALLWMHQGRTHEALALAERAKTRMDAVVTGSGRRTTRLNAVLVAEALGRIQAAAGLSHRAMSTSREAYERLGDPANAGTIDAALRAELSYALGLTEQAQTLAAGLCAAGFADPRFPIPCADAP